MRILERVSAHITRRVPTKVLPARLSRSIVSFTFDDFPKSSWERGGPILAHHNAPATFFVAGSLCNTSSAGIRYYDRSDLDQVVRAGHEIGSHTYKHHHVKQVGSKDLMIDIKENEGFLRDCVSDVIPETFAYPFGETSIRTKLLFSRHFACCRGTETGVNRGFLDLGQLKTSSLESYQWDEKHLDQLIGSAVREPCWIIFVTHDVDDNPSQYGSTPGMLEAALGKVRSAGLDIFTVKNALAMACFGDGKTDLKYVE